MRRLPALVLAATAGVVATRRLALHRHRSLLDLRPGLGETGIVAGAEAIELAAPADATEDQAALVLHGFGDTPQSVGYLAGYLQGSGWAVRAPLLPGHGRTLRGFAASGADDWIGYAREQLAALRARHRRVVLVGQSMGGAIATILAAEPAPPEALVLLAPYVAMPEYVRRLARVWPLWEPLLPFISARGAASILDEVERDRSLAYGAVSGRLLGQLLQVVELAAAAAPRVQVPVLVVQSRRDTRISEASCRRAFERLGSRHKRLVWLDDGGHVLAVDRGRERLFDLVTAWIDAHAGRRAAASPRPSVGRAALSATPLRQ